MNMNNELNNQNLNGNMESLNTTTGTNPNPTPMPNNPGMSTPNPNMIPNPMPEQNNGMGTQSIPNPMPIPPATGNINLDPAGMVPPTPQQPQNNIAQPLEATSLNAQTVMNPTQNGMGMPNENTMGNMNGMNSNMMNNPQTNIPNPNNNIGMMGGVPVPPPIPEEPKNKGKKKLINTPLLIILIVVLIAAIGYGVYYFLTTSKSSSNQVTVTPTLSELELGSEIGIDAAFYGRITPSSAASSCTVDTDLDTSKVGTYEYTITCNGKTTEPHTVEVKDTTAPKVEVKEVIVLPGTTVEADDFIESATDESDVTFAFEEEIDTSVEGEYDVNIIASDEYLYFLTVQSAISDDIEKAVYWNRVKISDGTREKIGKLGEDESYTVIGAYKDAVFLFGFGGESGTDRAFFLMNPNTFEITPSFSYDGEKYSYQYLDGKTFYMVDIDENSLKAVDLLTNEVRTVFPNLGLANPQTAQTLAVIDGRYVALYAYEEADNYYGQIVYSYAVDLEQQTIKQLEFRYDVDNGVTDPYQVYNVLPNGNLLVKTGRTTETFKMEDMGLTQDVLFEFDIEAFIPVEDFFNGVDNFTPIINNFQVK